MDQLMGKVAVVTGAGSGIGRALVERFANEGMRVVAADIDGPALDTTVAALREQGTEVTSRVVDVSRDDEVAALADHAWDSFGAVDVLVNNAGVFAGGLLWERPLADFTWVFGVNLWGVLHGIRSFVPRMLAQDTEGHIVNTCSSTGLFGSPYTGPYTISKFAAFAATEALAGDLRSVGSKLGVSALCPGAVATGIGSSDRNRPAALAAARSSDAEVVEAALRDTTAAGLAPATVADQVVAAIRDRTFLILTSEGYAPRLLDRANDLTARRLPTMPVFD